MRASCLPAVRRLKLPFSPSLSSCSSSLAAWKRAVRWQSTVAARLRQSPCEPLLVDFYADWCQPCRMIAPLLEKVVQAVNQSSAGTRLQLIKVNIDDDQDSAQTHQITSLPTVVLFRDGKELDRFIGLRDERAIRAFLDKHLLSG